MVDIKRTRQRSALEYGLTAPTGVGDSVVQQGIQEIHTILESLAQQIASLAERVLALENKQQDIPVEQKGVEAGPSIKFGVDIRSVGISNSSGGGNKAARSSHAHKAFYTGESKEELPEGKAPTFGYVTAGDDKGTYYIWRETDSETFWAQILTEIEIPCPFQIYVANSVEELPEVAAPAFGYVKGIYYARSGNFWISGVTHLP
jgi:hypothetical protein